LTRDSSRMRSTHLNLRPDSLVAAAIAGCFCVMLWSWPLVPAQDYPTWVFEGALLHDTLAGVLSGPCHLVSALPPNALAQLCIAALCSVVSPDAAGRLYLSACVLLLSAALVYLLRARDPSGQSPVAPFCLSLCLSYPLFHGFLNYLGALPALAWGIGYVLRNPRLTGVRANLVLIVLALVTYCCHGTALGVWGIVVACAVIIARDARMAGRVALCFVPALGLLGLYIAQRVEEGARLVWLKSGWLDTAAYRLRSPFRFLSIFQGLVPSFELSALRLAAPALALINTLFTLAALGLGLAWAFRRRRSEDAAERILSWSSLALLAIFLLLPHEVARLVNPAERLVLPLAFLLAAGLAGAGPCSSRRRWLRAGGWGLIALQLGYVAWTGSVTAAAMQRFEDAYRSQRQRGTVALVSDDEVPIPAARSGGGVELLTRHQPLVALLGERDQALQSVPFPTGFFRCPGRTLAGPFDLPSLRATAPSTALMLIGDPQRLGAIERALFPQFREVARGLGFRLLAQPQQ
jgi:hypothetical protein